MKVVLESLLSGDLLSADQAEELMGMLVSEETDTVHAAACLGLLQSRPLSVHEVLGFRAALSARGKKVDLTTTLEIDEPLIDLCGTGGDRKGAFNISTLAAFVVAGAGVKVAKHGNYGLSSLCGSSTALEHLGVAFTADEATLQEALAHAGIVCLHAPLFQPALKQIAPLRKSLGIRTVFNLLGPLLNPASPSHQLVGVATPDVLRLYSYVLERTKTRYAVVYTEDGYDEISLTGASRIRTDHGEHRYLPADFGCDLLSDADITGGDSIESHAAIFIGILEGRGTPAQMQVVQVNAASALKLVYPGESFNRLFEQAHDSLQSGMALQAFRLMRECYQERIHHDL